MRYSSPQVVFTEVPSEITLALSISGCPLRCKGCHSKHTYNLKYGDELDQEELSRLILKHRHITCVLFYGGEWLTDELVSLLNFSKKLGVKTCLYTGHTLDQIDLRLLDRLDFIKTGAYDEKLGGIDKEGSNQKFFKIMSGVLEDVSHEFRK